MKYNQVRHDETCSIPGCPGQNKKSDNIIKALRAVSAIVVFGIPLITGTAVMLGYGACKAYKKIKDRYV